MEELTVVKWVNDLLGGPVASLFHLQVAPNQPVIPAHVVMETLVFLILIVFFALLRAGFSVENPGKLQQAFELFVEFLQEQLESNVGHDGHKYVGIIGTLAVFILSCNLLGLVPGLESPTGIQSGGINVPAGCALVVFLFYQFQGFKKQGVLSYLKHFMGPVWWLAPQPRPVSPSKYS